MARNIVTTIPNWQDLNLPKVLLEVVMLKRGLILFVGGTGSGKSTSLAALIDYRNTDSGGHIIIIEDPVEYVHKHKKCIVNQREVGVDTRSWRGEFEGIKEIMEKSGQMGMQTFDTALFNLYNEGKISEEEALKNADSQNTVRLKIKLSDENAIADEDTGLSLESLDGEDGLV